jgi:hypothetical protein
VRIGSQRPRIELIPDSVYSAGDEAIELAALAGLHMDDWQQYVLRGSMGLREDGRWAASTVGLVCPRQCGKSVVLDARQLAGLFILNEPLAISSSHEFKTTSESFRRILTLIQETPDLDRKLAKVSTSHGNEGIELKNGNRLRFIARSSGSGRGWSATTVYLDEAYSLQHKEMAAMLPTMAANTLYGNTQLWFASSAGMPNSEVLSDLRERGKNPSSERLAYLEWSAADNAESDDLEAVYQANPGLGIRMSLDHVENERATLGDEEYRRERLGVWAKLGGESVIPAGVWSEALDESAKPGKSVAFAVDVPPGRESATICSASYLEDGRIHFEVVDRREGTSWVPTRMAELKEKWKPVAIVVDAGSAAGALLPDFQRARVRTKQISLRDYAQACGSFYDTVMHGRASHPGESVLDEAVDAARQKHIGETAFYWTRKNVVSDISPLVGCTNALYGLQSKKQRSGPARVLIL